MSFEGTCPISFLLTRRSHIKSRREEALITQRSIGVAFQNLRVVGLGASASYQPTLGSLLNPLSVLENVQNIRHPALRDILSGFEGVVRPGEMIRKLAILLISCSF